MSKKEDQIADFFREKLHNWAPEPPEGVWEAVQAAQKRKRRLFIYRISAAAAIVLLLISLPFAFYRYNTNNITEQTPATVNLAPSQNVQNPSETTPIEFALNTKPPHANPVTTSSKLSELQKDKLIDDLAAEPTSTFNPIAVEPDVSISNEDLGLKEATPEEMQKALNEMLAGLKDNALANQENNLPKERQRTSVAIAYNLAPGSITGENGLFNNILNYRFGPDPFQGSMVFETRNFKDVQESRLEAPFSAGLRLSFSVTKNLAFETGLSYTRLNTFTKTYPLDEIHLEYNQSLIYLGIPLGMRYDIFQTRPLNLYIAQIVLAEKGIVAINSINKFEKDRIIGKLKLYENVQGFQLSTTTSAGLGLNLHRYISFYAEGGLQIFYLNHTQPFNIRSSKKLWPVYQSGIRVNL